VTSSAPGAGEVLAERRWLRAHLDDPRVRVVEVDVSPAAYNDWHIDGAVLWNVYADLKDGDYRTVDAAAIERLITRSGIGPDSTVVFYGYAPAMALWLMKLYGHRDARILDCSRDAWRAAGYPWSTAASQSPDGATVVGGPVVGGPVVGGPVVGGTVLGAADPAIRADQAAVREAIGRTGVTLLDVRSAAEYAGERFWPSGGMEPGGRAGHVPSAVRQPVDGLYNPDGSFRAAEELRAIFAPAVTGEAGELITYCTIGGRAATAWFALTYLLGQDRVRVYDGSWAEWGRTPGAPVTGRVEQLPGALAAGVNGQRPRR
jgi:thiosulfate/3-mercaptopyruvate sulfurtransferase